MFSKTDASILRYAVAFLLNEWHGGMDEIFQKRDVEKLQHALGPEDDD